MKNNTELALLRAYYLCNETIKRSHNFRETISLNDYMYGTVPNLGLVQKAHV
jgi:hypothetical protein